MMEFNQIKQKILENINKLDTQLKMLNQVVDVTFVENIPIIYDGNETVIKELGIVGFVTNGITVRLYDNSLYDIVIKNLKRQGLVAYKFSKDIIMIDVFPKSKHNKKERIKQIDKLVMIAKTAIKQIEFTFSQSFNGLDKQNAAKIINHYIVWSNKIINELAKKTIENL